MNEKMTFAAGAIVCPWVPIRWVLMHLSQFEIDEHVTIDLDRNQIMTVTVGDADDIDLLADRF